MPAFSPQERAEEIDGRPDGIAGLHPTTVVSRFEDDRHPVVKRLGDLVWIGCENRKCLEDGAIFGLPSLPQSSEGVGFAAPEAERKGLLGLGGVRLRALPLVKGVGGDETAATLEGFAKERL